MASRFGKITLVPVWTTASRGENCLFSCLISIDLPRAGVALTFST